MGSGKKPSQYPKRRNPSFLWRRLSDCGNCGYLRQKRSNSKVWLKAYHGETEINKIKVTVKGEEELLKLAFWTDGKYSYSISLDKAVTQKEMKDLVMEATEKEKSDS